ncbi:baculoviral IAP repeat-containing protein 6-like isoform X2 [Teleopsis dalmanni]|uniref:baculoviral IAP repeat-containing protein 6-like isoform X2 n=1 Tax=Teleopsis dalmanni TaxID=139649 RepID=UPI0018CE69B6|nr:baculoviral IAP repeat-containing protein 6-like isoform X2 [Teleopsis dalmanni]
MANDPDKIFKQDGYLTVNLGSGISSLNECQVEASNIVYHPNLNVILVFDNANELKILDVHSGTILQTYSLVGSDGDKNIYGRYMSLQDKILIWDGQHLGFRGDYNGVLLFDTILQSPILQNDEIIKLELLLSEAMTFQKCLKELEQEDFECSADVTNELKDKIERAQANSKKGIKAQRWNTVCLELPYSSIKLVANNLVLLLKRLERHIPALPVASAINERLTDLLTGCRLPELSWQCTNLQRTLMHSEAVRRQTFEKWPHMDYKWALPDQMAQAGFYHQPSPTGEDRAMCFTCNVCLVCWEKSDEPWGEHERHSPTCPFVKGEYTQNVPLSVTYATYPAATVGGIGFDVISNSEYANVLCTSCKQSGEISVWSIERHLKLMHTFNIAVIMKDVCDESYEWANVTAICVLPNACAQRKINAMHATQISNNGVASTPGAQQCISSSSLRVGVVGSKIVLGISIQKSTGEHALRMVVLNIVECDRINENTEGSSTSSVAVSQPKTSNTSSDGDDTVNEQLPLKYEQQDDDSKTVSANFEKYADGFDSNGFVSALSIMNTDGTEDKSNAMALTDLINTELSHMQTDLIIVNPFDAKMNTGPSIDMDMDANYFKENLLAAAQMKKNQNITMNGYMNNNNNVSTISKAPPCEDIECVFESCTSVKRMNTFSDDFENEIVEISEILPINSDCNQLLVKLQKTKLPSKVEQKLIMATTEDVEYEQLVDSSDFNGNDLVAQLLLFDYVDGVISNEYTLAVTFNRKKQPKQLCILPNFQLVVENEETNSEVGRKVQYGALCVVCNDGTIKVYSLTDFKHITDIQVNGEAFTSIAYCRTLDRLCGCTSKGSLIFYSFNDADNESGDEMLEMDDESNVCVKSTNNLEITVTDGGNENVTNTSNIDINDLAVYKNGLNSGKLPLPCIPQGVLGVDCSATNILTLTHQSPSPTPLTAANCIAFKSSLLIEDLRTLYDLTKFDDKLSAYTAEVPSCWNDMVQAQKQRKQPQYLRNGDDTQHVKTWRLHNDATTWDEHTIELNLNQPVQLGHIDLKFTLFQQCHNPAAIQVTLLKQNTSGFGYRMKGPNACYQECNTKNYDDFIPSAADVNENPVLTDEYLQTYNAEILVGPIELSSCIDLCDQGGVMTLTSPKLFKTRTRNFLLHLRTMSDQSKDGQAKTRGCDWLHEISISVRGVKTINIPNERTQRIAMLESKLLLENLFLIISSTETSRLEKNLALDILIWICFIRLNRYRSSKSESMKAQLNKNVQHNNVDLVAQQIECISIAEKYIHSIIRNCIIHSDRSIAHKCVKVIIILTDGIGNMPSELQNELNLSVAVKTAISSTFKELPLSKHASVVHWFTTLVCATSTADSHNEISELCIKLLTKISAEISQRWDPYGALLGTRFGMYGFPFEPEIFDYELPSMNKNNAPIPSTFLSIMRQNAGAMQTAGMDIKKLCSIDSVDFRTFPHLIKCKSVSNQLRGLLEVEQLHFSCAATSEATRIDNLDSISTGNGSSINVEDIIMGPMQSVSVDVLKDPDIDKKPKEVEQKANGVSHFEHLPHLSSKYNSMLPKFKAICKYIELCDDTTKNSASNKAELFKEKAISAQAKLSALEDALTKLDETQTTVKDVLKMHNNNGEQRITQKQSAQLPHVNKENITTNVFSWHKLLLPPPKQMIVIDRMHSGARRFVVLDFGAHILLTDLVIPACDELASLHIDIWCFDEETDSVRLTVTHDIGTKTLVLTDLQPPPICRFMKITIIGRIGMSSTKCKIPIGSFYGHTVVLDSDCYGDTVLKKVTRQPQNLQAQIKALTSLYEDVHCRYSLASCKLLELLSPVLNCEISNVAHMQAFINKQHETEANVVDNLKIINLYEECIMLQHQINVIRNVINRFDTSLSKVNPIMTARDDILQLTSRDKLRVLSQSLVEILLHFSIEFGFKNILPVHQLFTIDVANMLFNSLVVYGDAHIQLATCSLLVRMCCFQSWWGDFLADIFCNLFSSQNSKIFPQDRIFFLLTYLGRRSIAMGSCRSIVIDAILKTLAKLLAPISPRYQQTYDNADRYKDNSGNLWLKSDLQLITWLLLFLSVCLDDNNDHKDKSTNRWDFMSCESDFTKSRTQSSNTQNKQLRCFKKRIIQNKYSVQPYTDWGKKIYMIQNEHPNILMELAGKPKSSKQSNKSATTSKPVKEVNAIEIENNFDKGLKAIRIYNILIVIRGLIALLLEMDFTCNMDQFLLTCKVIARLVSACRPAVKLTKIVTTTQLEQLIRLAVWNDQQQPWAVHAITCLLQDLLDADKHYKDNDATPTNDRGSILEIVTADQSPKNAFDSYQSIYAQQPMTSVQANSNEVPYSDAKYYHLPSLIECDDTEFDELLNDMAMIERTKPTKKDNNNVNKNTVNYFCKSISSSLDARLDVGLDINIEVKIRRLTMISSLDMYASLPQIPGNEFVTPIPEATIWPEYITEIWSTPEFNESQNTYKMFKDVFDSIFADLHMQDTWVHLEQVLHMWLTLNGELTDKACTGTFSQTDVPKIPFGAHAVQGLLIALAWHNDIKLRTWCLGFQCLFLACNSQAICDDDSDSTNINEVIINDEHFEKMLLRFFSGYGMTSTIISNRCAGPTICKHLHELLQWLHKKSEMTEDFITCKRKLKDILLHIILQLVQPGGAICTQQGPIDAQSQLVRDLLCMPNDKADLIVALKIIDNVSFLVNNNISNNDKLQCQRISDNSSAANTFCNLFANVLGSDNTKQNASISDNSLIISLIKLSSSLIQIELPRQPSEVPIPEDKELSNESQTDETKAEQLNNDGPKSKTPCIADTVLRDKNMNTMKRLLTALSNCTSTSVILTITNNSITTTKATDNNSFDDPQTTADAVFNMLVLLYEKASSPRLVIAPICQYLEASTSNRTYLPRLQLSEPFLLFMSKVLADSSSVQIFTQLGGINIICKNLVKLNKALINMQPSLISLIMQHMTKNSKIKIAPQNSLNNSLKKPPTNNAQSPRYLQEGLINFAPFCNISTENDSAQSADILISNPMASHRRPRTPAWNYMFYPNESHVDLTITLPTAVLLKEVQLQPHTPTLASCPSAVALEISRDYGLGPIPVCSPLTTTGMTCIRLKLAKAEIATSVVLRLYRPKDSSNIGLSQIAILGNTIFAEHANTSSSSNSVSNADNSSDNDIFAKTSIGWISILSRCFNAADFMPYPKWEADIIGASAVYPGFLEACCSLMNIMPMIPSGAQHNLETVLLKLGSYNKELCLSLIRILLWNTAPQVYKLTNESICDLLYELATTNDAHITDKIQLLLEWVIKLRQSYSSGTQRCNNPQSGFVKCIASILWYICSNNQVHKIMELITNDIFEACVYWIDNLAHDEPLKVAFDSLLCALCNIKPELFDQLLLKVDVKVMQSMPNISNDQYAKEEEIGLTDDNKGISGSEWFEHAAANNLNTLLQRPSYLATLALACQSPVAIYKLVDSGLPKLLSHALFEYCCALLPTLKREQKTVQTQHEEDELEPKPTTSASAVASTSRMQHKFNNQATDIDKSKHVYTNTTDTQPLLTCTHVPKILDFFAECCAEGHMRDWLGTQQGTVFWKPLLELLCNFRPLELAGEEPLQQAFIRMERATINFLTRVTSCHPKNQDTLTSLLIAVITKSSNVSPTATLKSTISGFTRQIVLQLLLENERLLVSIRSKLPLQRKNSIFNSSSSLTANAANNNSVSMCFVNNHPSKRVNAHHLLFFVNSNTKCQEILQYCVSVSSNLALTNNNSENPPKDENTDSAPTCNKITINQNAMKPMLEINTGIGLNFNGFDNGMEFLSVAAGVTAKDKRLKDVKNQVASAKDHSAISALPKLFTIDDFITPSNSVLTPTFAQLTHDDLPDILLSSDTTVSQILASLYNKGESLSTPCLSLNLLTRITNPDECDESVVKAANMEPLPTPLQRFSSRGGLSMLAKYLPTVYPESAGRKSPTTQPEKEKSQPIVDWVKLEPNDEIYEDLDDVVSEPISKNASISSVPQHSLAAFGLFLRLPGYSDVLLRDKLRAQCLLRLVLGVTGDGEGNDIYSLSLAPSLPTLPFEVFRQLLDSLLLKTDDGVLLRRMIIEIGAMHLVLNCLSIFTHQSQNCQISTPQSEASSTGVKTNGEESSIAPSDDKSHMYWAKGTGFGTGSTAQSWNVEQALLRQKK